MVIRIVEAAFPVATRRDYNVSLHGKVIKVTVTDNPYVVRRWIYDVRYFRRQYLQNFVIGLGVQWAPVGGDRPADILQLCVGKRCLIFQLTCALDVPEILNQILLDRRITFVGFHNRSHRKKLNMTKHMLEMFTDPLDLSLHVAKKNGESLRFASMGDIVWECLELDVRLRKETRLSNWCAASLNKSQVLQACLVAHCAFEIGMKLRAWRFVR